MRILQLTKFYPPQLGGIESATFDITEGLNKAGIPCDVLCANPTRRTTIEGHRCYTVFRISTLFTWMATSIAPGIIGKLSKINFNYDIIHAHFPNPMVALALFLVRPKAKLLIHWHSDIIRQRKMYLFFRPLEKWALKRADIIVGTSYNYLKASVPLKDFLHKTVVVPLGISTEKFRSPGSSEVSSVKSLYPKKKIIFCLGRLVYYKGFDYLIKSAEFLPDDVIILIGGEGELKSELQQLIKVKNLESKVKLLGRIPDEELCFYYQGCDAFCLPSTQRSEAFGVVQLEAMYFGKPIIATEIPGSGVSWVNKHYETGINVPVCDAKAIASAILTVLNDPILCKRFSSNSRRRFEENYTQAHMIDSLAALYKSLLNKIPVSTSITPPIFAVSNK